MKEKILAAIVTYGGYQRFEHLSQGIQRLDTINCIFKIIIIDNGTNYNLNDELERLPLKTAVEIYHNEENEGSAGGFGKVFELAKERNDFTRLLILDDDSLLDRKALDNIFEYEHLNSLPHQFIWSLYRPIKYPNTFKADWDLNDRYFYNRVVGISIQQQLFSKKQEIKRKNRELASLLYAPYAGMLINKSIVQDHFRPNTSFYLYVDDIDYSIQLKKADIQILQIENAKIIDLEGSWVQERHAMQSYFWGNENEFRYLYNARNMVFMIKNEEYITSKPIFIFNLVAYFIIALLIMPKRKKGIRKYKKLYGAIKDGLHGNMGYNSSFFE